MVKSIIIAVVCLVILVIGYFAVLYVASTDLGERPVTVIIENGDSFSGVANRLVDSGVVRSSLMLKLPARWRGIDKKLTPGRYDFTGENSCRSVLSRLQQSDYVNIKVTIIEGAPIWKVASVLAATMEIDSAEVIALNSAALYLSDRRVPSLEGYLYPDTYFFPWGTETRKILADMTSMFHRQTDGIWPDEIHNGLSREDVVTLASIVEAEALVTDEMPRISSVYHNRIRRNMRLQADPTVIYGLGGLDRPLMTRDLGKDTPYNTYIRNGLPPTPINSPSLAAIRAVLYPEETDFLFFVADGSGRHRFSKTNAEHNRARREIERARQ